MAAAAFQAAKPAEKPELCLSSSAKSAMYISIHFRWIAAAR
jgi:hypothetical protein